MATDAERQMILQNALMMETTQGHRVAWIGYHQAHVWRRPPQINHWIHLLVTLLTWGLWLPVWIIMMATEKKPILVGVAVNEYGQLYEFNPQAMAQDRRPAIQ